ncbi:Glycosyltransferase-like protein LARGE2 [Hypsibius exemplaris]|uniref:Glycosyltransferase-like protein LARGE2 n=1 Tax=Hypsibius exemplaris TaxID=2072580 RepID=A0A1W0WXZ4_HYPEX|nr:Glycosyltransferase-like protein LARGE2 [Hypsibius exemplaris]
MTFLPESVQEYVGLNVTMRLRQLLLLCVAILLGIFFVSVYLTSGAGGLDPPSISFPSGHADSGVGSGEQESSLIVRRLANDRQDGGTNGVPRPGKDALPVEAEREKCQFIHIAVVCAGHNSTRTAMTLIKSLLFYRSSPLHLHVLADGPAQLILTTLFDTWDVANLSVSYYLTDKVKSFIDWIPNKHYSGVYGLMKLVLPHILPEDLYHVVVLDTDIVFASDVAELWRLFEGFSDQQALGLVENQSDWYLGGIWKNYKPWPAKGRGYNTGVILMDLPKLRALNWMAVWKRVTERDLPIMQSTALADQDIFNSVLKDFPEMVYDLPCTYNAQLSDHSKSKELCLESQTGFKVIHWNSPKKMQVKHRLGRYYRDDYLTFVAHDGNLLRRGVLGCSNMSIEERESGVIFDESCYDFERLADLKFRTHLYFIDYDYRSGGPTDLTLVAQLSFDRLQMLEPLCDHWNGPISLALYMTDAEAQQFAEFVLDSEMLSSRRNIGWHIVYKDGAVYPVNYLRNVALSQANTPFVFLTDIDFLPMYGLYDVLKDAIVQTDLLNQETKALVVPAFETQRYRFSFPANKSELLPMVASGDVIAFRWDIWPKGHGATNFSRWMEATSTYTVEWEPDYEPYIVVNRNVPRYDNRFGGFGWNKVSHLMMLAVKGYELIVLPNAFIIHMPHAPSIDIAKFRSKSQYRKCLTRMKQEFVRDLAKVYGMKATKYLIS